MEKDDVITIIKQALQELYTKDAHLINIKASERSIVAKFACYFAHLLDTKTKEEKYDVDVEYNRYDTAVKKLSNGSVTIDFIVHKRGRPKNLIAIEFKTPWNESEEEIENDEYRIKELCTNKIYNYKYGFTIVLGDDLENTDVNFYNKEKDVFENKLKFE